MNLHAIVAPIIGAVNPLLPVTVRISVGQGATQPDGTRPPAYATPGSITASISGTTLDVAAVAAGTLQVGQTLADLTAALLPGTLITGLLSGSGGLGTYELSRPQTVASETMTTVLSLLAQVQALSTRDLRQIEGLNLQGDLRALYINGDLDGVVRPKLKGGDLVTLPDSSEWLVTIVPEPWKITAGWTKAIMTRQS